MKIAQKIFHATLCSITALCFFGTGILSAQENTGGPIPPEAHETAITALEALGPNRGARTVTYRETQILGVTKTISTTSTAIEATLLDLSAQETETEIQIELSGDVLFDFDKGDIRPEAVPPLHNVGSVIKAYKSREVTISGHTDSKGTEAYNLTLSQERADSVALWLQKNEDIASDIIKTFGYGESKPIAPNTNPDGSDCPDGRQKNRRVEIIVIKP